MTVISLVQSNIIHRRSSVFKKESSQKNKIRSLLAMGLIFLMTIVIFLYVLQVNSIAAKGYQIGNFKEQIRELEDTNKRLQVNISNLKSIGNLQLKTENFNMVKAQNIDYVVLPITRVVAEK